MSSQIESSWMAAGISRRWLGEMPSIEKTFDQVLFAICKEENLIF